MADGTMRLHTSVEASDGRKGYGEHTVDMFNIPNKLDLINISIAGLESQEQKLYKMLNTSTFEQFMTELHKLLGEAVEVRDALQHFKKSNLVVDLGLPENMALVNQRIEINLLNDSVDLGKIIEENLAKVSASGISHTSGSLTFSFDYNEDNIKNFLNAYFNQEKRFRIGKQTNKRYTNPERSEKTNPLRYANKAFKDLIRSKQLGEVKIGGKVVNEKLILETQNEMTQHFRYTKKDIQEAIYGDEELRQRILNSQKIIYNRLKSYMNGIPDLESAFDTAWSDKLGDIKNIDYMSIEGINNLLEKFSFFAKGGNLNAGVSGAVQELYTAIISRYVYIKQEKGLWRSVARILGNIAKGGEQPKTDVQILNEIGIQVKAYTFDRVIKTMNTNIHPNTLETSLRPYGIVNVADTIVQAVFNSTNGDYHDLEEKLQPALAQLMNFDTGKQIQDRVCFYLVDAEYLIPGSEIVYSLINNAENNLKIRIRSSQKTESDEYFNDDYHVSKTRKDYISPNFTLYYKGTSLEVTNENTQLYSQLMSKTISIDVDFDYSFMGVKRYSIFGH